MHFKKLELVGFKSFLNKTTLHFEPGITAIVGPNGTGKSNIYDSICWVLGEQSAKALRGSQMQDVIFNGTDYKEPLSMAEVSLTFDNTNRFFDNIDHPEVIITRRLFRSGESEYLLNKSAVRLKDISDLLMGTGIGSESYSLVAQGKIDLILSVRAEDRRLVFDEASGITKYKMQKKEAMRKLEETEDNLLRVNDIINEVKHQIASLERQATKARRYKEIFEELKSKEINLAILQKKSLCFKKDEIIRQLKELETEEIKLMQVVREEDLSIKNRQQELKTLEDKIMALKNEILNLDNLISRNNERINLNHERVEELEINKMYLNKQMEEIKNKISLDEERLNWLKEERQAVENNIKEKNDILEERQVQLNTITSSIKTSLDKINSAKKEILELVSKIAHTKNEITDLSAKQQVYLARKRRLELEKAKVNEEKGSIEENLKDINQELEGLNEVYEDLNLKISNAKNESELEGNHLEQIKTKLQNLENQILALASHKEFIEKLKTKYQDLGESMNAVVYLDKLPPEAVSGLMIKIKESDTVNLKLIGEAKPIDLDTQKLQQILSKLEKDLIPLKADKSFREAHLEELTNLMGGLEEQLRNQDIALANKKTFYSTVLGQFNKIKEEENLIIIELREVEEELPSLDEKITSVRAHQAELDKAHKDREDLITQQQNNISLNSNLKEKILIEIAQAKTELDTLAKRIDSDKATLKISEDTYKFDKESLITLEKQLKQNEDKQSSLALENKSFQDEIKETYQKLEGQKELLVNTQNKHQEISRGTGEVIEKIELARKELGALKNRLYEFQMQNKDIDFKFLSIRNRILEVYKIDLETTQDLPPTTESHSCKSVVRGLPEVIEGDENTLSNEIARLKQKLDSLGTVNLVAIEEYDELKSRYDFLIQQQNDLISAKESLDEAILKINRTTKKMFLETFAKIGEEFRNYFRLLFGGGDARLYLIDEGDPLESGIEIICRPPGKRLQNVLLLSGGEKALSAIALIFAIFRVKPSPFCILDEIDAALDEANIDRFGRLLQEFAKNSQFIVITHNKRTIINANLMYGITMAESGVSKIVSVKFAESKRQKDRAPEVVPVPA